MTTPLAETGATYAIEGVHYKKIPFLQMCGGCGDSFVLPVDYLIHDCYFKAGLFQQEEDGTKVFRCMIPACSKKFSKLCQLRHHAKIVHAEKCYECTYCLKKFTGASNIWTHWKSNHNDTYMIPNSLTRGDQTVSRFEASMSSPTKTQTKMTTRKKQQNTVNEEKKSHGKKKKKKPRMTNEYGFDPLQCSFVNCRKRFSTIEKVLRHLQKVHFPVLQKEEEERIARFYPNSTNKVNENEVI